MTDHLTAGFTYPPSSTYSMCRISFVRSCLDEGEVNNASRGVDEDRDTSHQMTGAKHG